MLFELVTQGHIQNQVILLISRKLSLSIYHYVSYFNLYINFCNALHLDISHTADAK